METQRLEEARMRKNAEIDRRMMQMRLAKTNLINEEKRHIALNFSKNFLKTFKRDTLKILVDMGTLRRPRDTSVGSHFGRNYDWCIYIEHIFYHSFWQVSH